MVSHEFSIYDLACIPLMTRPEYCLTG